MWREIKVISEVKTIETTEQDLSAVATRMMDWGKENCDEFPWRDSASPYESAVAEIMLIRTPPEQVLPVYREFLDRFPTVQELYEASEKEIGSVIEPLGLTWRAKRLKNLANHIVEERNGEFPVDQDELEEIPGVGPYAAATIRIFYYEKRGIMVDSNTVRFFERYFGKEYKGESRRDQALFDDMARLTPRDESKIRHFGSSFIDFMRKVCKPDPSGPDCKKCFLNSGCEFYSKRMET